MEPEFARVYRPEILHRRPGDRWIAVNPYDRLRGARLPPLRHGLPASVAGFSAAALPRLSMRSARAVRLSVITSRVQKGAIEGMTNHLLMRGNVSAAQRLEGESDRSRCAAGVDPDGCREAR
jgi:hypothetical protein